MNIYETLTKDTQQALDDLRKHLVNDTEVDLIELEINEKGLAAFVGYCVGYLRAKGCSLSESCEAVTFARTKNFWFPVPTKLKVELVDNDHHVVIDLYGEHKEVYDAEFELIAEEKEWEPIY